jgi:hypothetical protein
MLLYIAATPRVISVVIVVERTEEGKELPVQRPVYYLSGVLTLSKKNYPHYQKVAYDVYMAAKKLKHYFEEHHSALGDHRVQGRVRKSGQMGDCARCSYHLVQAQDDDQVADHSRFLR